jgi:4-methylaminobutanoate oxidase (formaldehyde-forming)
VPAADALADAESASAAHGLRPVGLKRWHASWIKKAYRASVRHRQHRLSARGRTGVRARVGRSLRRSSRAAVLARKDATAAGMARRIVQVRVLDPEPLLYHAEIVRDGQPVGYVPGRDRTNGRSARRSDSRWRAGGVTPDWLSSGSWQLDIAGRREAPCDRCTTTSARPRLIRAAARTRVRRRSLGSPDLATRR